MCLYCFASKCFIQREAKLGQGALILLSNKSERSQNDRQDLLRFLTVFL